MKTTKWREVADRTLGPQKAAAIRAQAAAELADENALRALRERLGLTQVQVAEVAGMTQGELSRAEHQENWKVSTLRKIARGLGGRLRVVVSVGGQDVALIDETAGAGPAPGGVEPPAPGPGPAKGGPPPAPRSQGRPAARSAGVAAFAAGVMVTTGRRRGK